MGREIAYAAARRGLGRKGGVRRSSYGQISLPAPVSTILLMLIPTEYSPESLSLQWRTVPLMIIAPHTITTLLPIRTGAGVIKPNPLRETSLICTPIGARAATQRVAGEYFDAIRISLLRSLPALRSTTGPTSGKGLLSVTSVAIRQNRVGFLRSTVQRM